MDRSNLIAAIEQRLGARRLIWFGTRGEDAESVSDIEQFAAAVSLIGRYRSRPTVESLALEDLTGRRPDLDTFELDDQLREPEVAEMRAMLLRLLSRQSAIFTYRPTTFLSGITFARRDRCTYLGMFKDHQSAFEHKPWLETQLDELDLPRIPWRYVSDSDQMDAVRALGDGPIMLRRSRTTGGVGLVRVDDPHALAISWLDESEGYVSVAPFIEGGVPVNVGAVVWRDGTTLHHASLQLVGVAGATARPFGYCGNDFGAIRAFDQPTLAQIEQSTVLIADRLRVLGYLGAFGVDFLVRDGRALFTEVNPRFQGSTHLSCRLSVEAGESCLLLDHLAAFLDIDAPRSRSLDELAGDSDAMAHLVVHRTDDCAGPVDPGDLVDAFRRSGRLRRVDVLARPELVTQPGATVARLSIEGSLTRDGFTLQEPWQSTLSRVSTRAPGGVGPRDVI